jgi:hypothetical protein
VLNVTHGLHADYFENITRSGTPSLTVVDPEISARQMTDRGIVAYPNAFSARWFGYVTIDEPGQHTFGTRSDDGSWLTIDGHAVVDNGGEHRAITKSGTIALDRGPHFILLEYVQAGGGYEIGLLWGPDAEHLAPLPAWRLSPTRVAAWKIPVARGPTVVGGAHPVRPGNVDDHRAPSRPIAVMVGDRLVSNDPCSRLRFIRSASAYSGLVFSLKRRWHKSPGSSKIPSSVS